MSNKQYGSTLKITQVVNEVSMSLVIRDSGRIVGGALRLALNLPVDRILFVAVLTQLNKVPSNAIAALQQFAPLCREPHAAFVSLFMGAPF